MKRVLPTHSNIKINKYYCTWENLISAACEYIVGKCCVSAMMSIQSQGTVNIRPTRENRESNIKTLTKKKHK